ncbi:M48 family metalloprotease [Microvirga thermotolerans]|uniref:M48 family metalloprotease n=1 Tax=Microvirga thermotolerans TaxID=2651334 RepID=A0A5P9JUA7_9HYPH|nr:M48 family metalloprotease [Microvirga thermotolerans]QFU15216.1 M48 family metalloprotease [Microvirga thermotolerans]
MSRTRHPLRIRAAGSALLAALLSGCAAFDGNVSLPADAPRVVGVERPRDRDHERLVAAFGGEVRSPDTQRFLNEVTRQLVEASDRPDEAYQVTILNSPAVNAFALPNGRLYVTRGLLALANDTSEIAAVLAHEIAHVTLRHASQRSELQARSTLIKRVTENVLNNAEEAALVQSQARSTLASFSRGQELEADQVGVKVLARAGFDPYGAPRFLTALGRSATGGGENSADMMASHPSTRDRISLALQAARRASGAPGIGAAGRSEYLTAIDGIAYGDDPSDGVVRGRRFIHSRLGVAFEAPEGFTLENTSQAVLGASADGSRRLLFDAADTPAGQSLEEVLRSTWNDTIEPGSLTTTTVNGLPVATALSVGKEWSFRLSAIRIGNTTYRLILAARSGTGNLDGLFQRTLGSVRQVTPEEARAIRPLRLRIVTAQPGDTVQTLAERMPVDRPLDRFLQLNGLERGDTLKVGERYKIAVE